jgi:hypothetical protein
MGLSKNDYNTLLGKWLGSSDGKKYLQDNGVVPYTEEQMIAIAEELYTAIIAAYKAQVQTNGADYFDMSTIHVGKPQSAAKGKIRLRIIFDKKGLSRRSLHVVDDDGTGPYATRIYYNKRKTMFDDWSFTGPGVYDILGLFTQGYTAKPVYGNWWDNEVDSGEAPFGRNRMRSMTRRQGDDFIKRTIDAFKRKYPSIEVEYPRLWGGTK